MFWSNLFKNKNKIFNTELVNNSSFKIPSFEELTAKEQEYVNKLKEEYLKFYETEDNYINLDNELFNKIKMYQELALDIMHNDHFGNIASSIIDSKKLVYYSHKITEINNSLKYKYIALNEVRKDKKYLAKHMGLYVLGKRKINILKALDHQMNIINNMFVIADQKITDYCACAIANYPKNIDKNTKKELQNRHDEVEKDYKDLFNTSITLNNNTSIIDKTTYTEIFIDEFIYENKDLIDKLKEQLDLIANSEINDKKMQQEIIDNLMKIKMYYNIFNKYGRNKLTQKDFEELYQIIFNVYTYFPLDYDSFTDYFFDGQISKDENKFYRQIIEAKVEMLKMKQSPIFKSNKTYPDNIIDNILYAIDYKQVTKGKDMFPDPRYTDADARNIMIIFYNLKMLLSLDYEDGLVNYFNSLKEEFFTERILLNNKINELDYLKLVLGIKKLYDINTKNSKNDDDILNPKIKYYIDYYNRNKGLFDIYELICKPDFNMLPNVLFDFEQGMLNKNIIELYYYDKNRPIYFYPENKDFHFLMNDNENITFAIPEDTKSINLLFIITNKELRNISGKCKVIIPCNFKDMSINIIAEKGIFYYTKQKIENLYDFFVQIGQSIILKEDAFLFIDEKVKINYAFESIFHNLIEIIEKYRLIIEQECNFSYLWLDIFKDISLIDNDNKIHKLEDYFPYNAWVDLELNSKTSEYYYKKAYKSFETAIHNYFFSKYTNNVVKSYLKK
mgnify:FL=1